jgi:hypothetical protein
MAIIAIFTNFVVHLTNYYCSLGRVVGVNSIATHIRVHSRNAQQYCRCVLDTQQPINIWLPIASLSQFRQPNHR